MKPSAYKQLRAVLLWSYVAVITLACAMSVCILFPFVRFFDKERHSLHLFGFIWAKLFFVAAPWWKVTIRGRENLAKPGEPAVYVANHLSQADIMVVFLLNTRFRWLSKESIFKIPVLGWAMRAIGYVGVSRGDRSSHERCMRDLRQHLERKTPVFFFPEGTRSKDGITKPFKSGAFRLAEDAGVPVIPISLVGTDGLLPKGSMIPNDVSIEIIVHPKIEVVGSDADTLMEDAYLAIASTLPVEKRGLEFEKIKAKKGISHEK